MTELPALRIGVVLDSRMPVWVCRLLEAIRGSDVARLVVAVRLSDSEREVRDRVKRPGLFGRWLGDLYARIDSARFLRRRSELAECDSLRFLEHCPVLEVQLDSWNGCISLDAAIRAQLRTFDLDVLFHLGHGALRDGTSLARFGAWAVRHGREGDRPGLHEFVTQRATTDAGLLLLGPNGEKGRLLGSTRAGTDPISLHRGMDRLYWQSVHLVMKELRRLHRERSFPPAKTDDLTAFAGPPQSLNSFLLIWSLAGAARRALYQRARDRWAREQWFIAYQFGSGASDAGLDLSRFHQITPPPDRTWADPFIVTKGDRAYIFVEEYLFQEHRGALAVIEADSQGNWTEPRRIIERPYHLSYPYVFPWNGSWYMVPESQENGTIQLFRASVFPDQWDVIAILMEGIRAVDTTVFEWASRWWMLTSTASTGRTFNQLLLFHAPSPLGPWIAHDHNPVLIDIIGGRCAGRPFVEGGKLFRPAQDGSRRYGYAIQIRQIVTLTPERFEERVVASLYPDWDKGLIGTHTLNTDGRATVVDGLRRRWNR